MRSLKNIIFSQKIFVKYKEFCNILKKIFSRGFPDNFDNFYLEDYVNAEAISGRVLHAYTRYLIKKFSISDLDQYSAPLCPYFDKYNSHISGLVKKAITKYRKDGALGKVSWPSSGCKEIDILVKRYLKRTYKITVNYSILNFKYIYSKGYNRKPSKVGIKDLFFSLLKLFKPFRKDTKKFIDSQIIFKKRNSKSIILLAHQDNKNIPAYNHLSNELSNFFFDKEINVIKILPNSFGINNFQRIKSFFIALLFWINFTKNTGSLKIRDLDFLFFYFSSREYKKNLISIMNRIRTKCIISVYIDRLNEPNFIRASREIGIKYFHYDYSMGYPYSKPYLLRYLLDTRRYADVIFANSTYRLNQYKYSTLHLDHPPKLKLHLCPQIDYSIKKSVNQNINKKIKKKYKIALIDNSSSIDLYIKEKDIHSLFKVLNIYKNKLDFIVQSKRGSLIKIMKEMDFHTNKLGTQGDFSNIINADIVIALNLQGAALKACFAFDKPMLIFSKEEITSLKSRYSFDDDENRLINNAIKNIWVNEKKLIKILENILNDKNYSNYFLKNTRNLLNLINLEYSNNLSFYFKKYLN